MAKDLIQFGKQQSKSQTITIIDQNILSVHIVIRLKSHKSIHKTFAAFAQALPKSQQPALSFIRFCRRQIYYVLTTIRNWLYSIGLILSRTQFIYFTSQRVMQLRSNAIT